jgi:UrcA family protein
VLEVHRQSPLRKSVRVQYNPIMSITNSGRALLDDKIAEKARRLCTAGGRVSNTDDNGACVRQAIEGAKSSSTLRPPGLQSRRRP